MMNRFRQLIFLFTFFVIWVTVQAAPKNKSELNGFHYSPPLLNIKYGFIVNDDEKPIVNYINDASDSIAYFILEVFNLPFNLPNDASKSTLNYALPSARQQLRLPPKLSGKSVGRYVSMQIYCWRLIDESDIEARIEWADNETRDRYLDSYIFKKADGNWYFSKHGEYGPVHWLQHDRYSKPPCEK